MDGRSRTERYKSLREEVANETQRMQQQATGEINRISNDLNVNTRNTVSTDYDRMLREQEEFLKSLDRQFDSLTRTTTAPEPQNEPAPQDNTVADIQKSVRDFFNQPFEKNLEDTLQTNIRELREDDRNIPTVDNTQIQQGPYVQPAPQVQPVNPVQNPAPVQPQPVVQPSYVPPTVQPVEPAPVQPQPVYVQQPAVQPFEPAPVQPQPSYVQQPVIQHVEPTPVQPQPVYVQQPTVQPVEPTPVQPQPVYVQQPTVQPVEPTPVQPQPVYVQQPTVQPVEPTPVQPQPVFVQQPEVQPQQVNTVPVQQPEPAPAEIGPIETVQPFVNPQPQVAPAMSDIQPVIQPQQPQPTVPNYTNTQEINPASVELTIDDMKRPQIAEEPVQTIEIPVIKEPEPASASFDEVWSHIQNSNEELKNTAPEAPVIEETISFTPTVDQRPAVDQVAEAPRISSVFGPATGVVNPGYNDYNPHKDDLQPFSIVSDHPEETVYTPLNEEDNAMPQLNPGLEPKEFNFGPDYLLDDDTDFDNETPAPAAQVQTQEPATPERTPVKPAPIPAPIPVPAPAPAPAPIPTPAPEVRRVPDDYRLDDIVMNPAEPSVKPAVDAGITDSAISSVTPTRPVDIVQPVVEELKEETPNVFMTDDLFTETTIKAAEPVREPEPVIQPQPVEVKPEPVPAQPVFTEVPVKEPVQEKPANDYIDVDDLLADLPDVMDDYNQKSFTDSDEKDVIFEDDYDKIISEFKNYNIEKGIRNNEDTTANIISELNKDENFAPQQNDIEDDRKSFFDSLFGDDTEGLDFNEASFSVEPQPESIEQTVAPVTPVAEPVIAPDVQPEPVVTPIPAEPVTTEFLIDDEDEITVTPQPQPKPEPADPQQASTVNELTQQLESEREARQKMFEQTQQMKLQMSEQESELNVVNNNVSKTNKILNIILTLLIIALFAILIVIVFFFAQERGLI